MWPLDHVVPWTLSIRSCSEAPAVKADSVTNASWSGPNAPPDQTVVADPPFCASALLSITSPAVWSSHAPPIGPFARLKVSSTGVVGKAEVAVTWTMTLSPAWPP